MYKLAPQIGIAAAMIGSALAGRYELISEQASTTMFFALLALSVATLPRGKSRCASGC
ncbi:MAG: hypothetical protein KDD90_08320 [Sphingomonadaceae bacterium]|jgi:hypothetical protein|nr:hypothetical protein [Sphingomonadaceae bacterium]MCP5384828.1 hypothetical protein [Altererythrobacter sp.]